jgi:hypothetical protein
MYITVSYLVVATVGRVDELGNVGRNEQSGVGPAAGAAV